MQWRKRLGRKTSFEIACCCQASIGRFSNRWTRCAAAEAQCWSPLALQPKQPQLHLLPGTFQTLPYKTGGALVQLLGNIAGCSMHHPFHLKHILLCFRGAQHSGGLIECFKQCLNKKCFLISAKKYCTSFIMSTCNKEAFRYLSRIIYTFCFRD